MTVDAERLAHALLRAARQLGGVTAEIADAEKSGVSSVLQEADAAELIQIQSPAICRALRILAQRLDRAAVVKFEPEVRALELLETAVDAWEARGSQIIAADGRQAAVVWLDPEWMFRAAALFTG